MRAYPEYKDSGVEWLGAIPAHWEVKKISYVAQMRSGDSITSEDIKEHGNYPVFGGNGFRGYCGAYNLHGEYVLIGRQGALCGNINYGTGKFWASEHAVVVYPSAHIQYKWLGETLRIMDLNQYSVSAAQPGLSVSNITALKIPFPPTVEQQGIANYLDRETARIDKLIREKQNFIKLLKEKRQALISHVVTKGLDPTVKMKDSGVEWIGEVPEHWVVKKIKFNVKSIGQGWSPQCESTPVIDESAWAVVKVGCVNGGIFNARQNKKLPDDLEPREEFSIKKGDLLVSRANAKDWVGSAAVPQKDYPNLLLCDKIYRLKLDASQASPDFISYYLGSGYARKQIEIDATGTSSSMLNIGQRTIMDLPIPQPELEEQLGIVEYVRKQTNKLDNFITEVQFSIDLLQEHRTALISAAVTGKIDVRDQA